MHKDGPGRPLYQEAAELAREQTAIEATRFREALEANPLLRWPRFGNENRRIESDNFGQRSESWQG